ncbi:MAG: GyrI-like domain-containing protein [Bacteroidales bacterium]
MFVRIEEINEKKLVGKKVSMTLNTDKTVSLWSSFMPVKREINNTVGIELYSLQVYANLLNFNEFTYDTLFEKWAAVEVSNHEHVPDGMDAFLLPAGFYAVFLHRGLPADFTKTAQYIFGTWLPESGYEVDNRPHFEVLGEKYRNNHPESEEEVWVPIKKARI